MDWAFHRMARPTRDLGEGRVTVRVSDAYASRHMDLDLRDHSPERRVAIIENAARELARRLYDLKTPKGEGGR